MNMILAVTEQQTSQKYEKDQPGWEIPAALSCGEASSLTAQDTVSSMDPYLV